VNALGNSLLGLAAAALVAALVYLYDKTQAVDLRESNEVLGLLRELKEIDGRWDVDVLRARLEPGNGLPALNRAPAARKALQALAEAAQRTSSPALSAGLPELTTAMEEKSALVEKYTAANRSAKAAFESVLEDAAELQTLAAEQKSQPPAVQGALDRLLAVAPRYYWLAQEPQRKRVETALGELQSAAAALPAAARDKTAKVLDAGAALLRHKPAENELFNRLAFLTSGPRLDNLTFSFSRELEGTLQDKERYRVYLIAYAGALLILLAYLGVRLKAANQHLEVRVNDRTRELSEALQHLKESEAQLIQSEKMSSLGQMVAGVAHEINTPLAYVKNSLGTVADKLPELRAAIERCDELLKLLHAGGNVDPEELNRQFAAASAQLAQIRQQKVIEELGGLVTDGLYGTGQMAEIVGNLKDFSRLDRSKVTSFNLNDGLNSTLMLAKHLLKPVAVKKQLGGIPSIVCSPSQVNQVFLNLITNATQALEGNRETPTLTLTTRSQGGGVAVEFADNGKGIAPDVLPRIFDPFFSTKEVGKGTGLGLSISYKIVQQHGGRIDVQSQVGAGSKFTVWLPLKPPLDAQLEG
jgi:signal transduction histidine kinase